ncbi:MAG TPA: sulfite exporter TauE/SafE family protein [Blastocatellia bacterium]|nr:sulfite exporter TauE/SafE family protein [Blastocatellia bacterium]
MDASLWAVLTLGFSLGLRHALDPDHLVAVTTIVSEHKSLARSSLVGTFWGLGHTASLLIIGLVVIFLRSSIPDRVALWMEMGVAVMLIVLGANVLWRVAREQGFKFHTHTHSHDDQPAHEHVHFHSHSDHDHRHRIFRLGRRPFVVGMVHGVAGSAALTLGVLATIPSISLGLVYIAVFGLGSVGGMLLMSAIIGAPFAVTARRFSKINGGIRFAAGLLSVVFGFMLAWDLLSEIISLTA